MPYGELLKQITDHNHPTHCLQQTYAWVLRTSDRVSTLEEQANKKNNTRGERDLQPMTIFG